MIDNFNKTLRQGERTRELVGVEVLDEPTGLGKHEWSKTNLVTVVRGSQMYDKMRCDNCGITGKRFGLGGVTRDSKYKAKKYEKCNVSI